MKITRIEQTTNISFQPVVRCLVEITFEELQDIKNNCNGTTYEQLGKDFSDQIVRFKIN